MSQTPTPEDRFEALRRALEPFSEVQILRETLARNPEPDSSIPVIAQPLVKHIKVICVDTESFTRNTDCMTELGLVQIKYDHAVQLRGVAGEHGHKLLGLLRFLHFRIVENAHLKSNQEGSLGPEGNLYGNTKWTTFDELRTILDHLLNKPITGIKELEGCVEPVVLVGHALQHDIANAEKSGLQYNLSSQRSVVAKIDTQILARKVGLYKPTTKDTFASQIGLKGLTEVIGFEHDQPHTACNDASRTMICAIHMVLSKADKGPTNPKQTMQEMVRQLEANSRNQKPPFGTQECCPRCGGRDHEEGDCNKDVFCDACKTFDRTDDISIANSHSEMYCPHIAQFKAGIRRVINDSKKTTVDLQQSFDKEFKNGPAVDSHPWGSYPKAGWRIEDPAQVMADCDEHPEPPVKVRNLQAALGPFPVPAEGEWVLQDGSIRQAPAGPRRLSYAAVATLSSASTTQPAMTLPIRGRGDGNVAIRGQGTPRGRDTGRGHGRGRGRGDDAGGHEGDTHKHKTHGVGRAERV